MPARRLDLKVDWVYLSSMTTIPPLKSLEVKIDGSLLAERQAKRRTQILAGQQVTKGASNSKGNYISKSWSLIDRQVMVGMRNGDDPFRSRFRGKTVVRHFKHDQWPDVLDLVENNITCPDVLGKTLGFITSSYK